MDDPFYAAPAMSDSEPDRVLSCEPIARIFGGAPKPPQPVVTPMPDINDPSVLEARRRALEAATARSGRASTVLTGEYGNGSKLGAA